MAFRIASKAFDHLGKIPRRYTCEGDDVSPPLSWTDPPAGALSFALIVEDPDAPDPEAPKMTWTHWALYNLPADARELEEGVAPERLPEESLQGRNDWKRPDYGGPCPPIGRHRYFHRLYALDVMLPDLKGPTRAKLLEAMEGHIVGGAELIGTYQKGD
ncbi:MAG: YbhB/YbcL family Raf kinase inhibitor-like protein [Vicinamibacteria bacterium]